MIDPLAQTFLVTVRGGVFVTKLDLFFAQKDDTLPVWVEIRNVSNGYPAPKLLPFGRSVKQALQMLMWTHLQELLQQHLLLTHQYIYKKVKSIVL